MLRLLETLRPALLHVLRPDAILRLLWLQCLTMLPLLPPMWVQEVLRLWLWPWLLLRLLLSEEIVLIEL